MIDIAPETASMLYVGGLLSVLLFIWLRHSQKVGKRDNKRMATRSVSCEYCGSCYLVESFTSFHRCPYCQCVNKGDDEV